LTKEKNVVITNHENIFLQCRVKMRIVVSWQSPQRDAKDTNHISVWKPDVLIKISVLFHPGELHEQFQLEFIWNTCVSVTKKQLALSYLSLKMESSAGEATEDCSDVLPEGSYICFIWGLKMNCHLSSPSSAGYEQWAISTSTFRHCVCVLFRSLQCPWV